MPPFQPDFATKFTDSIRCRPSVRSVELLHASSFPCPPQRRCRRSGRRPSCLCFFIAAASRSFEVLGISRRNRHVDANASPFGFSFAWRKPVAVALSFSITRPHRRITARVWRQSSARHRCAMRSLMGGWVTRSAVARIDEVDVSLYEPLGNWPVCCGPLDPIRPLNHHACVINGRPSTCCIAGFDQPIARVITFGRVNPPPQQTGDESRPLQRRLARRRGDSNSSRTVPSRLAARRYYGLTNARTSDRSRLFSAAATSGLGIVAG